MKMSCCCCSLPGLCVSVCFDRVYIQTTHSVEQQCSHSVAPVPLTEPINGVMLLVVAWDLAGEKRVSGEISADGGQSVPNCS